MLVQNCNRTSTEISSIIKALSKEDLVHYSGPRKAEEIVQIETLYEIFLPEDYRQFLGNYGALQSGIVDILGLDSPDLNLIPVEHALLMLRLAHPDIPMELLPVEIIGDNIFACLVCSLEKREKYAPVVQIDAGKPQPLNALLQIAPCFRDYLFNRLKSIKVEQAESMGDTWEQAWLLFEKHVLEYQEKFDYDHSKGGKLPRNTDWRPYRYCIQDVVFGVTVVRHHQEGNCLQIDVFLSADVPEYGPLAGSRALTAFLLSEAYKCGGSMELWFTNNVEGGQIPLELRELANLYGINFSQKNRIDASESKALYAAMTGFSPQLQAHIQQLEKDGKLKMARACYVVNHGVWSKEQLEMIVLGSENPESILSGQSSPEQRHLYHHDLLHARSALLAGMFERILLQRERQSDDGVTFDMEDDFRKLEISFDGQAYLKLYKCSEAVDVPWLYGTDIKQSIPENVPFQVAIRSRGPADLLFHASTDIQTASKVKAEKNFPTFVLFPRDFLDMPKERISQLQNLASQSGIGILVSPEAVSTLDVDASQRLATSRVLRQ